jgi:SAM-dependent methyltransferase
MSAGTDVDCPLCAGRTDKRVRTRDRSLYACGACGLLFADAADRLSQEEQKKRYLLHDNRIEDRDYCNFLSRPVRAAMPFLVPGSKGLDYGCGHGPVLSRLLEAQGFTMTDYDPLFFDVELEPSYDFIFSTECFEHFEEPAREIPKVLERLKPGGVLTVMTELWSEATDLADWYYATDPTHVSFYSEKTLDRLCGLFGMTRIAGDGRRVFVFRKN